MNHILTSWKSTLQGLLSGLVGLPSIGALTGVLTPKQAAAIAVTAYIAKQVLAGYQQDAGVTLAKLPGSAEPVAVPSTEVPLNPNAVPVAKENS